MVKPFPSFLLVVCPQEVSPQNKVNNINRFFVIIRCLLSLPPTIGLCDVGGFEILPPGTAAQLKY
jgi:hypothetical protein